MINKNNLAGIALVILAFLLSAGTVWLFPTCAPTESGAWMKCHWSGQAIIGTGVVMLVLSAARLALPQRLVRAGVSIAMVPVSILSIAIPYGLIGLCDNAKMQCRVLTLPAVTILSSLYAILAVVDTIRLLIGRPNE